MLLKLSHGKLNPLTVFGRPLVKRFAMCYRTVVLSVCPVLFVCPVCNVGVLCQKGWMDQDETWHEGRHWPWPHCVRWGPSYPPPKQHSPLTCLLWPNGWMDTKLSFVHHVDILIRTCGQRFLQRAQCSHCKRCISYGNSVCPSVRHTPVLCQNDGT